MRYDLTLVEILYLTRKYPPTLNGHQMADIRIGPDLGFRLTGRNSPDDGSFDNASAKPNAG